MNLAYTSSISATDLGKLQDPFIYGWCRDGVYLYIGSSQVGFKRLLTHNIVGVITPILDSDYFHFWYPPVEQLRSWERKLINLHRPNFNDLGSGATALIKDHKVLKKKCFGCGNHFSTIKKTRKFCCADCQIAYNKGHHWKEFKKVEFNNAFA